MARTVRIFNLQRYNMYDGPGVRSIAFLKGCPLRCKWCSNPESQHAGFEVMFKQMACINCGACVEACPVNIHKMVDGVHEVDRSIDCIGCRKCEQACMQKALSIMGEDMSVEEVVDFLEKDADFYRMSGGGITLGGGETLAQPQAALSIFQECKARGLHTAIETCGFTKLETIKAVAPYVDLFLFDIKQMNPVKHKEWTGVNNEQILENISWLLDNGYHVRVRMPLLKGVNDDTEEINLVINYFKTYSYQKNFEGIDLLPYHKLGVGKYAQLGREYPVPGDPSLTDEDLARIEAQVKDAEIEVRVIRH